MSENCLFIGGPADGERRIVDNKLHFIRFAHRKDAVFPLVLNAENTQTTVDFQTTVYYRRPFSFKNNRKLTVFAPDDLTDYEIFMKLLDGYHPNKEKYV